MKRPVENPQVIALLDLPEDGRPYVYTRESGELNEVLQDVLGDNSYKVDLFVEKIGNAWQASGTIESQLDLQCSRCGCDMKWPVQLRVREILMVQPEMPRSGKLAKVNHSTELDPMGPDCVILHKPELHVGEFSRELIVLNEPFQPLCENSCENPYLSDQAQSVSDPLKAEKSPFAVLKDFKLNS